VAGLGQEIRYVWVGDRTVAWARTGTGPPLVIVGWWASDLERDWADPDFRQFVGALGTHRTVIRYDRPGTGLSDHDAPPTTGLDEQMAVLAAVVSQLGDLPVSLFGIFSGAPVAVSYARRHPERVDRLVLFGPSPEDLAASVPTPVRHLRAVPGGDQLPWRGKSAPVIRAVEDFLGLA